MSTVLGILFSGRLCCSWIRSNVMVAFIWLAQFGFDTARMVPFLHHSFFIVKLFFVFIILTWTAICFLSKVCLDVLFIYKLPQSPHTPACRPYVSITWKANKINMVWYEIKGNKTFFGKIFMHAVIYRLGESFLLCITKNTPTNNTVCILQ